MRWSIIFQAGMAARQGCTFVIQLTRGGYEERSDSFNYLGGHRADAGEFVYQPQESNGREARGGECRVAQVDVVLQRRADLIPNLVETVKGFAAQEQTVFGDIAKARSALLGAHSPAEKIAANGQLDSALGRLLVVVENYPS